MMMMRPRCGQNQVEYPLKLNVHFNFALLFCLFFGVYSTFACWMRSAAALRCHILLSSTFTECWAYSTKQRADTTNTGPRRKTNWNAWMHAGFHEIRMNRLNTEIGFSRRARRNWKFAFCLFSHLSSIWIYIWIVDYSAISSYEKVKKGDRWFPIVVKLTSVLAPSASKKCPLPSLNENEPKTQVSSREFWCHVLRK